MAVPSTRLMPPVPALVDRVRPRQPEQPEQPTTHTAGGGLRCLWYNAGLADTFSVVDDFLCTPAGAAALADYYRAWRGSRDPELDARTVIDAVGLTAARLRA